MSIGVADTYCRTCRHHRHGGGSCPVCGSQLVMPDQVLRMAGLTSRSMYLDIAGREVRGLSIYQPYAALMGVGKVETRTWHTEYRGLVLLCSTAKPVQEEELVRRSGGELALLIRTELTEGQPRQNGHALYLATLADCRPLQRDDAHFLRWHPVMPSVFYGWHFEDVIPIRPFPVRGQQRLWKASDDLKRLIERI